MKSHKKQIKKIFISLFVFSFLIQGLAQESLYKHHISINTLSLLSPYYRSLDISYGFRLNNKIYLELGIAPILPINSEVKKNILNHNGIIGKIKNKGIIYKIEPKYILSHNQKGEKSDILFISTNFYRTNHEYQSIRFTNQDMESTADYNVNSKIFGIVPQIGTMYHDKKFYSEIGFGFGYRWLIVENDYNGDIDELSVLYRWNQYIEPEKKGIHGRYTISLSFKIGFLF
jgi:hypothetical protein